MHDHLQDIHKVLSGLAGAFVSLRFINGTWFEKFVSVSRWSGHELLRHSSCGDLDWHGQC